MKAYSQTKDRKLRTRLAPAPRCGSATAPAAPFRGAVESELEQLKGQLLRELLEGSRSVLLQAPLRRATNEAAALAWTTPFPLLVLPELVREKAESARRYARRQATVLRRSRSAAGSAHFA